MDDALFSICGCAAEGDETVFHCPECGEPTTFESAGAA